MAGRHDDLRSDLDAYQRMKHLSSIQLGFVLLAIAILISLQEGQYDGSVSVGSASFLKFLLLFVSLLQVGLIHGHYRCRVRIISTSGLLPPDASLYRADLLHWFLVEAAICLVLPYPLIQYQTVREEQMLGLFVFSRLYLFFRFFYLRSYFTSSTGRFVSGFTKIPFPPNFVYRVYLAEEPYVVLIGGFLIVLLIVAYCVFVAERSINENITSYNEAMWLTVVTIMTIGYGDITCITPEGRAVILVGAFAGIISTALIITLFHRELQLSSQEQRLVTFLKRDRQRTAMVNLAASCIQIAYKLRIAQRALQASNSASEDGHDRHTAAQLLHNVTSALPEVLVKRQAIMVANLQRKLYLILTDFRVTRRQFIADTVEDQNDSATSIEHLHNDVREIQDKVRKLYSSSGPTKSKGGSSSGSTLDLDGLHTQQMQQQQQTPPRVQQLLPITPMADTRSVPRVVVSTETRPRSSGETLSALKTTVDVRFSRLEQQLDDIVQLLSRQRPRSSAAVDDPAELFS
jgi:hypothetical protein